MSIIWAAHDIENKHALYHEKDCVKKFCSSLRDHANNITDFEKKNKKELKSHQDAKVC